jgi:hypothetical protein
MPRWVMFLVFVSVMCVVYGGTHYYLYSRLLSAVGPLTGGVLWVVRAVTVLAAVSFPVARGLVAVSVNPVTRVVDFLAAVWMGVFLYLLLGTLVVDVVGAVLRVAGLLPRLDALLGGRAGVVGVAVVAMTAGGVSMFGLYQARCAAETTVVDVSMRGLPAELDGFRVVHLSDVHIGAIVGTGRLRDVVAQVNALEPDLVLITGDLVDEDANHLEDLAEVLRGFRSRHGVLASTGNHEFYARVDEVVRQAALGNVRYLRNEKTEVAGALLVYGVDDPTVTRMGGKSVPLGEVVGPEAGERPSIVMHHQPRGVEPLVERGVDLVLSGHTHGGQLWPIRLISERIYPYQAGAYRLGRTLLYVSRGTGTWGPPLRVGSPPEVVLLRLHPAPPGG